ncbi:MAG: heparinase [Nitrospiraceae bacterium]|nr:MAG: heparinase [Nitrospiraceae bacterium]
MKALTFLFIKVPRKILKTILNKSEHIYFLFFYRRPESAAISVPGWFLLPEDARTKNAADMYRKVFPANMERKIKEADVICGHHFDLLGSGDKKLSPEGKGYQPIDWHIDFKSGYRWDTETFYRDISVGHKEGVDIKVPWELSRFQHLNILGHAYILSGNRKYADEVGSQITDWIRNNRFCFGVNWKCAMDVAIRAVNWLVAMEYFAEDDLFSGEFIEEFHASVREHGKFIRGHLEYAGKWTTNHYLADIAGLFFISVYCPFFKESSEWREFAFNELHREMEKQVYPDGCSFESSTSYHRLALEMFFYSALLGRRAGIEFSEDYVKKLRKMFEASMYCIKPNGMIPQIGDNDSGRFLQFSKRAGLDHSYLLSLAALHFKDDSFKLRQVKLDEEAFWLFGEKAITIWDSLDFREGYLKSHSFPDAGWYVMRHENNYCFVSCGPNGGDGWHAHNDKLSFELMINGQDVIVDPGTYVYTSNPSERNKFRSTGYHNTVAFDGYEQNDIPEQCMFSLTDRVRIVKAEMTDTVDKSIFEGEIRYADVTHKRIITLDKKTCHWQITDDFHSSHQTNAELLFHLAPSLKNICNDLVSNVSNNKVASLAAGRCEFKKGEYDYSPEYGAKIKAEFLAADVLHTPDYQNIITYIRM